MRRALSSLGLIVALAMSLFGQSYSFIPNAKVQYLDANGNPLSGGKVYTCAVGSTCPGTPLTSYSDIGVTPNTNPVILDAAGRATIYLSSAACYKIVVQNTIGSAQWTQDGVCASLPSSISGSVVDSTSVQTLSNKTLNNTNTVTVIDNKLSIESNSDTSKIAQFSSALLPTSTTRVFSLPNGNTTLVGTDVVQSLTNKTLQGNTNVISTADNMFAIHNSADTTKVVEFDASGVTTATIRVYTAPDVNGALVIDSASQTLTNKTLTSPSVVPVTGVRSRVCSAPIGSVAYASFGTDSQLTAGSIYWAEIYLPATMTITGITTLNGSVASGNIIVGVWNGAGVLQRSSTLSGTAESGTNLMQNTALTSPYVAPGPGRYFVGIQQSNSTGRYRTVAASTFVDVLTGGATGSFGTLPTLTPPASFTADLGPIACFY